MFTKAKNIDSAFRYVRLFTIIVIICCVALCGFIQYSSFKLAAATQSKVYVLANGKVLEAIASERKDNIVVEGKDHVQVFHQHFFTLDPDEKVVESNVTKALYMGDASVRKQYMDLKENGYYSSIIAGNISQRIEVDSVFISTDVHPYYFKCYSTQKIIRATSIVSRSLITEGYLRNVFRSDHNPHGFLIERWKTLENKDLKIENR
jgi:conjugative transposon TraK protein